MFIKSNPFSKSMTNSNRLQVYRTGFFEAWRNQRGPGHLSNVLVPELVLATQFSSNAKISELIDPENGRGYNFTLRTGIGTQYSRRKDGAHDRSAVIFSGDNISGETFRVEGNLDGYAGDIVEDHIRKCLDAEKKLGGGTDFKDNLVVSRDGHVTTIAHNVTEQGEAFVLETRLRSPLYFLPDGFIVDGKQYFDVTIYSEARKIDSGFERVSSVLAADGSAIIRPHSSQEIQLVTMHGKNLDFLVESAMTHYHGTNAVANQGRDYYFPSTAEDFLAESAETMSHVEHWDLKEAELRQSAEQIAKTILTESLHKDKIEGVVLYGSLARKDKLPGDIDLLLLVDSKGGALDPFKYFDLDDQGRPRSYNVEDVTDGIAKELGIIPQLITIGEKRKDWRISTHYEEYPDEARHIQFSELGGGINLGVVTTDFFTNPQLREQYMRLAFTPTYFQDVLTDGLAFDAESGTFSIPTREVYAKVIESLKGQLEQAKLEKWPNIGNKRPRKTV